MTLNSVLFYSYLVVNVSHQQLAARQKKITFHIYNILNAIIKVRVKACKIITGAHTIFSAQNRAPSDRWLLPSSHSILCNATCEPALHVDEQVVLRTLLHRIACAKKTGVWRWMVPIESVEWKYLESNPTTHAVPLALRISG